LERAYLVSSGLISEQLLRAELEEAAQRRPPPSGPFHETIGKTERELLDGALQAAAGNKSAAATALGMKLSTFRDKLVKHGLL
jgi:DNA-binding NtrC family response regulator